MAHDVVRVEGSWRGKFEDVVGRQDYARISKWCSVVCLLFGRLPMAVCALSHLWCVVCCMLSTNASQSDSFSTSNHFTLASKQQTAVAGLPLIVCNDVSLLVVGLVDNINRNGK